MGSRHDRYKDREGREKPGEISVRRGRRGNDTPSFTVPGVLFNKTLRKQHGADGPQKNTTFWTLGSGITVDAMRRRRGRLSELTDQHQPYAIIQGG